MNRPSPALVAQAYLKRVRPDLGVTTNLPALTVEDGNGGRKDNWGGKDSWVTTESYGTGTVFNLPTRSPIVRIAVWGKPTDKPRHWGRTLVVAQDLLSLTEDWYTSVRVEMPYPDYYPVEISCIAGLSDVRRIENDPQELARIELDTQFTYSILV